MSGLFISAEQLKELSEPTQYEIIQLCVRGVKRSVMDAVLEDGFSSGVAVDLSSSQANRLVKGLSEKSRNVLLSFIELSDQFAEHEGQGVYAEDLAANAGYSLDDIKGVWSGLTRRTRSVTEDKNAELFHWEWDDEKEDNYAIMHPATVANLKRAFNK